MTATAQDIKPDQLGTPDMPPPNALGLPIEANTIIYGGTPVFNDAAGYAVDGTPNTGATAPVACWGRCKRQVNNLTSNSPYGAQGAQNVLIEPGAYYFAQDGSITIAMLSRAVFALDNQTATINPVQSMTATSWLPFLGTVQPPGEGEVGLAPLYSTKVPVYLGYPSCTGMVLHANIPVTLANIQAQTSGTAFNFGPPLPANAVVLDWQANLTTPLTGGGETHTTFQLQGGTDAAGTMMSVPSGAADFTTGAAGTAFSGFGSTNGGSNPYAKRGGQQMKATLTATGGTLAGLTAGVFSVDIWYSIVF